MEFYSCYGISHLGFAINNCLENSSISLTECVSMCCKDIAPRTTLTNNPKENLERLLGMRHFEIIRGMQDNANEQDFPCAKCEYYVKGNWSLETHISDVNLSMYPSPCQCHCSYCDIQNRFLKGYDKKNPDVAMMYENAIKTLDLAKKIGLTVPQKTTWHIACGEITIHPYKEELLNLVSGENVYFYTNAFIFDEAIARELHDNPLAIINFSIDSGTAETWHKVKGVNNFYHVLENLKAYRKVSRTGQILLKYIILPGVNDSDEDFLSFVSMVKSFDAQFRISRDVNKTKELAPSDNNDWNFSAVVESAARLLAICHVNGISPDFLHGYTRYEQNCIVLLTNKLLEFMR